MPYQDRPQEGRYDYEGRINSTSKDIQLDFSCLEGKEFAYNAKENLSKNLQKFLQAERANLSKKTDKKTDQRYFFGLLYALDKNISTAAPSLNLNSETSKRGVDGFGDFLMKEKQDPIVKIRLEQGNLCFLNQLAEIKYQIPLAFGEDPKMAEVVGKYIDNHAEIKVSMEQAQTRERAEFSEKILGTDKRALRQALPPRDLTGAVDRFINLPKVNQPPFYMDRSFWISSQTPPQVINTRKSDALCSEQVRQMLFREGRTVDDMPFSAGLDAWNLKSEIESKKTGQVVSSLHDSLAIFDNKKIMPTGGYYLKLPEFAVAVRNQAQQLSASKESLIVTFNFKNSKHQADAIRAGTLNTHAVYCLGVGQRPIESTSIPASGLVTDFIAQSWEIQPEFKSYLSLVKVYKDGQLLQNQNGDFLENGQPAVMTAGNKISKISVEDVYFNDAFDKDSRVRSLTQFLADGQYLAVDALAINAPKTERQTSKDLPNEFKPVRVFYLKDGESLQQAFNREVAIQPEDFLVFAFYLEKVGFDVKSIMPRTEAVPVPDFDLLKKYIETQGGMEGIKAKDMIVRADEYMKNHPDEKVIIIKPKDRPEDLIKGVKDYFSDGFYESLSVKEKKLILDEFQKLNAGIDLRLINYPNAKTGQMQSEPADFQAGRLVWVSREVAATVELKIRQERLKVKDIQIPDTLLDPQGKEVTFSDEEKQLIYEATSDPTERILLTLILINEQKTKGRLDTNWREIAKDFAQMFGKEIHSLGKFQVRVGVDDLSALTKFKDEKGDLYYKKLGCANETEFNAKLADPLFNPALKNQALELLKNLTVSDDRLNVALALARVRENLGSVRYYLQNVLGEEVDSYDPAFLRVVATAYSRPRSILYTGLIGNVGMRVGKILADEFPALSLSGWHFDSEKKDFVAVPGASPLAVEWNPAQEKYEQLSGRDTELVQAYWRRLGAVLIQKGAKITPAEIEDSARAIIDNKPQFLKSPLYAAAQSFYAKAQGEKLSLLPKADDVKRVAVVNYGYRVTNNNQIADILAVSPPKEQNQFDEFSIKYAKKYGPIPPQIDVSKLESVDKIRQQNVKLAADGSAGKNQG